MNSDGDFEISLGESKRKGIESKPSPLLDRSLVCFAYDDPASDSIPVFIRESVIAGISAQATADSGVETGGVLVGGFYRTQTESYIEIDGIIEAPSDQKTDISFTFTHESWKEISKELARLGENRQIVGWYHTHPGLGVFMSREDDFIHNGFFRDPWQVALVLDPMHENWGCFRWKDGSLVRTRGFYIFEEKRSSRKARDTARRLSEYRRRDTAAANAASSSIAGTRRTRKLGIRGWLPWAIATLVLAGLILSIAMRPDPPPDPTKVALRLIRISDYSDAEDWLRRAVAADRTNSAALRELERLVKVRAALRARELDSPELDGANLIISASIAANRSDNRPLSVGERIGVDKDASQAQASAASARAARLAEVYWRHARTWPERVERARLASNMVRASSKGPAESRAPEEYRAALRWLQGEKKRFHTSLLDAPESTLKRVFGEMTRSEQLDLAAFANTRRDPRPKDMLGAISPEETRRLEKPGTEEE